VWQVVQQMHRVASERADVLRKEEKEKGAEGREQREVLGQALNSLLKNLSALTSAVNKVCPSSDNPFSSWKS
jgi:hypothetical protein